MSNQFVKIPKAILSDKTLPLRAKIVYAVLADLIPYYGDKIGMTLIANTICLSKRTVWTALKELESCGLITMQKPQKVNNAPVGTRAERRCRFVLNAAKVAALPKPERCKNCNGERCKSCRVESADDAKVAALNAAKFAARSDHTRPREPDQEESEHTQPGSVACVAGDQRAEDRIAEAYSRIGGRGRPGKSGLAILSRLASEHGEGELVARMERAASDDAPWPFRKNGRRAEFEPRVIAQHWDAIAPVNETRTNGEPDYATLIAS